MKSSPEELLRAEIVSLRQISFRLVQWGLTVIVSIQTALWFIRKEVIAELTGSGKLPQGSTLLPWDRHLIGTVILCVVAFIFAFLTIRVSNTLRHYREQLPALTESGIKDLPVRRTPRRFVVALFFIFPALDVLMRLYIPYIS